jgi:outer membrane biosynthesis protein TonB
VRADVRRETKDQAPWEQSALEGEFYFKAPPETPKPTTFDLDALFWDSVRNSAHREDFAAYLERFPNGAFAVLAKSRMAAAPSARQGAPAEAAKAEAAAKPPEAASSSVDPPKSVELSSLSRTTASPEQAKPEATAPVVIASLPERSGQGALAPDFAFERFFGGMAPEAVRAALAAYRAGKAPKALAVSGDGKQVWRAAGRASMLDAQEGALEGCEFLSRAPCRLVSSEDGVGGEVAGDGEFRVMPRLATSGAPAAATTPFVGEPGRTSPWLAAFLTQSGPKALALHPSGQADWASGATQREAEAKALADCERARPPDEIACVLYAAGDEIVLARRATSAIALEVAPPAAPIVSTPVAPKAAPTPQRAKPAAKPQPRQARRPPVEAADEPAPRRNAPQRAAPRPAKPKAERARQEPPAARQRCFSAGGRTYCS